MSASAWPGRVFQEQGRIPSHQRLTRAQHPASLQMQLWSLSAPTWRSMCLWYSSQEPHFSFCLLHRTVLTLTLSSSLYPCGDKDCLEDTGYLLTSDLTPVSACALYPHQPRLSCGCAGLWQAPLPVLRGCQVKRVTELEDVCKTSACRVAFAKERSRLTLKASQCI